MKLLPQSFHMRMLPSQYFSLLKIAVIFIIYGPNMGHKAFNKNFAHKVKHVAIFCKLKMIVLCTFYYRIKNVKF